VKVFSARIQVSFTDEAGNFVISNVKKVETILQKPQKKGIWLNSP
jgi:hypothetical protein